MSLNIPLFNSCCCFSLRTGTIIIGSLELFVNILYFVSIIIYRLRMSIENPNTRYIVLLNDIIFEYAEVIQLAFSCFLIYGVLKEKSGFIIAWLLTELTKMIDGIWDTLLISIWYYHLDYFLEQIMLMGITTIILWVVYSYYSTIAKSKSIL